MLRLLSFCVSSHSYSKKTNSDPRTIFIYFGISPSNRLEFPETSAETHLDHRPVPRGTKEMRLPSRRVRPRRRHRGQHPRDQRRERSVDWSLPKPQSEKLKVMNNKICYNAQYTVTPQITTHSYSNDFCLQPWTKNAINIIAQTT